MKENQKCVYCKKKNAIEHSNPPCCDSKECYEKWNSDRLSWEADCLRERGGDSD